MTDPTSKAEPRCPDCKAPVGRGPDLCEGSYANATDKLLCLRRQLAEANAKLEAAERELAHTREAADLLRNIHTADFNGVGHGKRFKAWFKRDQRQPVASGAEEPECCGGGDLCYPDCEKLSPAVTREVLQCLTQQDSTPPGVPDAPSDSAAEKPREAEGVSGVAPDSPGGVGSAAMERQRLLEESARLVRNHVAGENVDDPMHHWADRWDALGEARFDGDRPDLAVAQPPAAEPEATAVVEPEYTRKPVGRNSWTLGTCKGCGGTNAALFDGPYCCKSCRLKAEGRDADRAGLSPAVTRAAEAVEAQDPMLRVVTVGMLLEWLSSCGFSRQQQAELERIAKGGGK